MLRIRLDDDFYLKDAVVYGIVSELPDYRLCYFLNNHLALRLTRNPEDRKLHRKEVEYTYSEFSYEHPLHEVTWNLTTNRSNGSGASGNDTSLAVNTEVPLVADLRSFDFFLWYEGDVNNETDSLLNKKLKELSYVRAFQKVDTSKSKNINNLLLEY